MAVGLGPLPELLPVAGIRLGTAYAGIRKAARNDLTVIEACEGTTGAAVFTRNAFCAAPVTVARGHLAAAAPRWLVVNAGNANAGTGRDGLRAAEATCAELARLGGTAAESVLPFSTGVIGEPLPVDRLAAALPTALEALDRNGWEAAAHAIMTTDTLPKGASRTIWIHGARAVVTGITKGAGMIRPDMATMLAYVATDAEVPAELLQRMLDDVVDRSFNRITVDGDTSTNDALVLLATGRGGLKVNDIDCEAYAALAEAVEELCIELAQAIVRDGEGATKFITVEVEGGRDAAECHAVADTIAHSPLVKTAFFASDPNWGRILACVGRAGVPDLDLEAVRIHLDEVCIVESGGRAASYEEAAGQRVMDREEITIRVSLGRGEARSHLWTCDLSHQYVSINADYRS